MADGAQKMTMRKLAFTAMILMLAVLAVSGCSSPTATPRPSTDSPKDVVTAYWQAIDKGDYNTAYDLVYQDPNITKQQWIDQHRAMWGDNGSSITIYNFTVTETSDIDPSTFPGNFSAVESVVVNTDVAYYGKNTTGLSQFAAVKIGDSWRYYGAY